MSDYGRLGASEYVLDAYVRVLDAWRYYEDHGDDGALRAAGDMLCETLGRLSGDQEFWGAAIDAMSDLEAEEEKGAFSEVLSNLAEFREFEERALMEFGVPVEQASRLVSDLIVAIRMAEKFPDWAAIVNLQNRVGALGERMCEVANARPQQRHKWRRRVLKGMKVLGGGAAVVVDGLTAPVPPLALVSIGGGLLVMGADALDR